MSGFSVYVDEMRGSYAVKLTVRGLALTRSAFVPGVQSEAPVSGLTPMSPAASVHGATDVALVPNEYSRS